jgi:hypothetical protein
VWVRNHLDEVPVPETDVAPQPTVAITDTTFWGRRYGVCVFRSAGLKKNIWWSEVEGERMAHYRYGRAILEEKGWKFLGAVVDGRRGFFNVFNDIPVQMCQFHQIKQVAKYLTRRPQTDAGQDLWTLTLTLTKTDEATFTTALEAWHAKWSGFIEEKTENTFITGKTKWYYTHKKVRSAYYSLKRNLPYLFTYAALKKKLAVHHGLRRDCRSKVISQLLKDAH